MYKYLTKAEQQQFIDDGGLDNLPECYSCKSTKDTIWQMHVKDDEGNQYNTCPVCLDCYTLDAHLVDDILDRDGQGMIDFSIRKNCKEIKALNCHCKSCGTFMMAFGKVKYCSNDCEEAGKKEEAKKKSTQAVNNIPKLK